MFGSVRVIGGRFGQFGEDWQREKKSAIFPRSLWQMNRKGHKDNATFAKIGSVHERMGKTGESMTIPPSQERFPKKAVNIFRIARENGSDAKGEQSFLVRRNQPFV